MMDDIYQLYVGSIKEKTTSGAWQKAKQGAG